MYSQMSVEEKLTFLKELDEKGYEWAFAPINRAPFGLTYDELRDLKRQEWEDDRKEECPELTFEEWFEDEINEDELVLGVIHEICCLEN